MWRERAWLGPLPSPLPSPAPAEPRVSTLGGGGGGAAGGMPSFDFNIGSMVKGLLSNPGLLIYGLPLIMMGFNILSSLFSLVVNYWYVLMILPMVPAPQRKQVMVMMFMYAMFGRGMYFL